MVELRVLGPLQLSASNGQNVEPLVRQSKRAALLVYLAVAVPRAGHRRDKLLALFWPEADHARARAALNQALYVLRSSLGEDSIQSRGDDAVVLNLEAIWCDAVAFEVALDASRQAEALALYQGDLLDGFFVSNAPEFEHWLDQERDRLRYRASEGAWALAEVKAGEGEAVEAERWARRAAELLPADEAVVRRLMTFLHGLGDRAAAVRAYEAFAWRLEEEYELEPSAETQALAVAIREERLPAPTPKPRERSSGPLPTAAVSVRRQPRRRGLAVALAAAVLGAAAWAWLRWPEASPRPVVRFTLEFAGVPPLASGVRGSSIALSPDGAHLVYLGMGQQGDQLFLRRMDRLEAIPIPHTRGAHLPFFSPDGEWLGFVVGTTMRKVRLAGGPAITICVISANVSGASWGPNDVIVFAAAAGLWQVSASGGEAKVVAVSDTARGETYRWPEVLPSGRAAVFTKVNDGGFHLAAVSLETGTVRPLGLKGTSPRFVKPGHLVFARSDGALLTVPFDAGALRHSGNTLPVAEGVLVGMGGAAKLGVSSAGALAYVPEPSERTLVLVDRAGRAESVPVPPQAFGDARLSPDGGRIAAPIRPAGEEQSDIWVLDLVSKALRRVTFDGGNVAPVWSPDGERIAFSTNPGGRQLGFGIQWMALDESLSAEALVATPALGQLPVAFTPDGRALVFQRRDPDTGGDIWILSLEDERTATPYLRGPADERAAAVSPDGRWLAYVSDESGRDEVYVDAFPDPGGPVQISVGGGREPRWAPNARELFYRSPEGMVAARVRTTSALSVVSREPLFDDAPYISWLYAAAYDVHPDGARFVMIRRGSEGQHVVVVLNSFDPIRAGRL